MFDTIIVGKNKTIFLKLYELCLLCTGTIISFFFILLVYFVQQHFTTTKRPFF